MNVLLVSPLPPPSGGMATWTEQYLKDSNACNTVYIVNTAFIGERALHRGGRVKVIPEVMRFLRILRNYQKILNSKPVDIIHINSSCSRTGILRDALCVALARKHYVAFHCHCNIQDQLTGIVAKKLGKYVFNEVNCVLVLNKSALSYVNQVSHTRVVMIPNAIDHTLIASNFSISEKLRNIIYVGHVKKKKGIGELIEAARREKDITFHLVGPVADEIAEISSPENIIFYGRKGHAEAMELMKAADAFLFPSYTEGFSMVMLEAMATGLPIIASNAGANAEMIESGGGIIINPKSCSEIVKAIDDIRPKEVRERMSAWNLNKVDRAYRDDMVYKLIQEVYREICV